MGVAIVIICPSPLGCGHIENCAQVLCTNSTDHFCEECEGNHMVARAYSNLGDQCERKLFSVNGCCVCVCCMSVCGCVGVV